MGAVEAHYESLTFGTRMGFGDSACLYSYRCAQPPPLLPAPTRLLRAMGEGDPCVGQRSMRAMPHPRNRAIPG